MGAGKRAGFVAVALAVAVAAAMGYVRYPRIPTNVAYVSEQDGGISVVDLGTMKVIRRVHSNNDVPRGIASEHLSCGHECRSWRNFPCQNR